MKPPTIDDRCVLLYTARLILRANEPELIIERLTSGTVASLTKKGYWLVQQYMEVLPDLLKQNALPLAEKQADEILCARHGWPTMASLGYQHRFPDDEPKPSNKEQPHGRNSIRRKRVA